MADSYSSIYIHIVYAVKNRASLIDGSWETDLQKYIAGIVRNRGQKLMAVNTMPDHIHILVGIRPDCLLADLVKDIKANSSRWINDLRLTKQVFRWQNGYGSFSVGRREVKIVSHYIWNQKIHHAKRRFREEYLETLRYHYVVYDERFVLKDVFLEGE